MGGNRLEQNEIPFLYARIMPLNILGYVALAAALVAWFFISDNMPINLVGTLVIFGIAKWIVEYRNRKKQGSSIL
ncbi:MAG TPA: hypothetical protein VFR84_15490 [Candidatus Angelobacter sp.]|nr:hypothetical protein [Candidatus Angelobacter sp.]